MKNLNMRLLLSAPLVLLMMPLAAGAQTASASASCSAFIASDFPKAVISNGAVQAVVYLPDAQKGYYRGTRFDWSGVVPCLTYKGHDYFGIWFSHYDPLLHDAIAGPVEEFRSGDGDGSIGYDQAKPGELFIKPGVGVLRRVDESPYTFRFTYPLVDGGQWTVHARRGAISFTQRLRSALGIAYSYEKVLKLDRQGPFLVLEHHLKNTGTKVIDTQVYQHDFFMLDGVTTGPDTVVKFLFEPQAKQNLEPFAKIDGKELVYLQELPPGQSATSYLTGFSDSAADNDFTVENRVTGVGVEQTGSLPLSRINFWSIATTICPEAYVHLVVKPGATASWSIRYRFFAP